MEILSYVKDLLLDYSNKKAFLKLLIVAENDT